GARSRCILAGYALSWDRYLAAGRRRRARRAGLIGLSTYLPTAHEAGKALEDAARARPLFMAHGTQDPVVPFAAGEQSAQWMREHGFEGGFHRYPMPHSVCIEEIRDLGDWMSRRIAAG